MSLRTTVSRCAPAILLVCGWALHAQAAIVGGDVTGGATAGGFELLASPPAEAGPDAFDSPNLIAFDEQQNVLIDTGLAVTGDLVIPAGSVVSSHYVVFDPLAPSSVEGFVDFDGRIVAVIRSPQGLAASQSLFGADETMYSGAPAIGTEPQRDDFFIAPGNDQRLRVSAFAISPGDHVRVLTGVIPEPAALLLCLTATAGMATVGFRAC